MAKKKCNPYDVKDILNKLMVGPDGNPINFGVKENVDKFFQDLGKIDEQLRQEGTEGFIDAVKEIQGSIQEEEKITDAERAELFALKEKVAKSKKTPTEALSIHELETLRSLLVRLKHEGGTDLVTVGIMESILSQVDTGKPRKTIDAKISLENALDRAKAQGDTTRVNKISKALQELSDAELLSKKLDINWNAIKEARDRIAKIQAEMVIIRTLLKVVDNDTNKTRQADKPKIDKISSQIKDLRTQLRNLENNNDLTDAEYLAEAEDLQEQIQALAKQRQEIEKKALQASSKVVKNTNRELEQRLLELEIELQKAADNQTEAMYRDVVANAVPINAEFYKSSLRDIKKRAQRIKDNIAFVEKTIQSTDKDYRFTKGEAERLFGTALFGIQQARSFFAERVNPEGEKTATNKPVYKQKENISKDEMLSLLKLWKDLEVENMYDDRLDREEAKRVEDIIVAGNRKLMNDVTPGDVVPTARSRADANQATVGRQYDPDKMEDRVSLIRDLTAVKARLSTLSTLPQFNGVLPEWALVSALGTEAQSLFSLFDSSVIDPQEINYTDIDATPKDNRERLLVLKTALSSIGYTETEIAQMPEFSDLGWIDDFNTVTGVSFSVNKAGQLTAIYLSPVDRGRTLEVIKFVPNEGETTISQEQAFNILTDLTARQNSGSKLVSHDGLAVGGLFEKLAILSGNSRLAMSVAARSYDTGMVAFRSGVGTKISRFSKPTLENLARAFYSSSFSLATAPDADNRLASEAVVTAQVLLKMVEKRNKSVDVATRLGSPTEKIQIKEVVPLWYDTAQPGTSYNQNYAGFGMLFDIQPFQNIRDLNGGNVGFATHYRLDDVDTIVTNILIAAMEETNPDELDNIISGLVAAPDRIDTHYNRVLELSELNHSGYMPLKRRQREANGNQYLLIGSQDPITGNLEYTKTNSKEEYIGQALKAFKETISVYRFNLSKALQRYANNIGFRELDEENGETLDGYIEALFVESNKQANQESYTFDDYGNGNFDYVPAMQLGRGFAQIVLGFIKPGNTLTEKIDTPVFEAARRKEEAASESAVVNIDSIENLVETTSYLPLKMTNVSFFAPLSDYEQERIYGDWALRKRYTHILNRTLTDSDRANWESFIASNSILSHRQTINNASRAIKSLKQQIIKETDSNVILSLQKELKENELKLESAKKQLKDVLEGLDKKRLPQGRVQRYYLINPANNRDLYSNIPTAEESLEMSLEIALDLPQFIATLVHDSINYPQGSEIHLEERKYIGNAALSAGGPVGQVTLAGVHSLVAHMVMNPQLYRNADGEVIDLTTDIIQQSLMAGYEARSKGVSYSKTTYYDDKFSGIHHLLAMQIAYFGRGPEETLGGNTIKDLLGILKGGLIVDASELTDYYEKSYTVFTEQLDKLNQKINDQSWNRQSREADKESVRRIQELFGTAAKGELRTLFKGTVIPIIYSGGKEAVIKDLKGRRKKSSDPSIQALTDNDIEVIANTLAESGTIVSGRLIDQILDMDPTKASKLAEYLLLAHQSVGKKANFLMQMAQVAQANPSLMDGVVNIEVLKAAIRSRAEYVAELSIPQIKFTMVPQDSDPIKWRQKLIKDKTDEILKKWQGRIDNAQKILADQGVTSYEKGTKLERDVLTALAGGKSQFKTQASLLFINKLQNSGYKIQADAEKLLEHQVKIGRYIDESDIMYRDYVVFMSVAFGTTTGRMEYPGNYLSNLQSGSLSKGVRLVYKKENPDEIDWKETTLGSMWLLTENPLANESSREKAMQRAKDLSIKNFALMLATDYDPEFMGYDINKEESRERFFEDWDARSNKERGFENANLKSGGALRERFKELYKNQQIANGIKDPKEISDEEIDQEIASNSVAFANREGIRTLVSDTDSPEGELILNKNAAGLGSMIPRIADSDISDSIVHGLNSIYNYNKQRKIKAGKFKAARNKAKELKLKTMLGDKRPGASVFDPNTTPYIPITNNSFSEVLFDYEPSILQKVNRMKFVLDRFALDFGFEDLVRNGDYARLYMMHQIKRKTDRYLYSIRKSKDPGANIMQLKYLHRQYIQDLFRLSKFQRDIENKETDLLAFKKTVAIDPSKFKYKDGTNMNYLDALVVLEKLGANQSVVLQYGLSPNEFQVLGTEPTSVLKDVSTMIKPWAVQGRDVTLLMMEVLADDSIKRIATDLVTKAGVKLTEDMVDKQGFVRLSQVNEDIARQVIIDIFESDEIMNTTVNNLNLYVTTDFAHNSLSFTKDTPAKIQSRRDISPNAFIIPRPGTDPTVNRVKVGPQLVKFILTAEATKRMLNGARNAGPMSRLETSVQTNKYIGVTTTVGELQSEAFSEYLEKELQRVAEETEILQHLHQMSGKNNLRLFVNTGESELRDELGLTLNPYDAVSYFQDDGTGMSVRKGVKLDVNKTYRGLNPYWSVISTPVIQGIETARRYPALAEDLEYLEKDIMESTKEDPMFKGVMFLVYLKSNAKELDTQVYQALVAEAIGADLITDEEFEKIEKKANDIMGRLNRIKYSTLKGKNPYRAVVIKALEAGKVDTQGVLEYIKQLQAKGVKFPESKDREALVAQAITEARATESLKIRQDLYADIDQLELLQASYDPATYAAIFAGGEGHRINAEIDIMVSNGTITKQVAGFYRLLIGNFMITNPAIVPFLSITPINTSNSYAGEAIKEGDKFKIRLNTNILKQMGTIDQVRVFAHEIAHIARLAYIKDNSSEWRRVEALVHSQKGKQTVETMLLAMSNGKKYIGFDDDVAYYTSNPEEFIAQWGSWVLFQKTFNNVDLLKYLQTRNRGSVTVMNAVSKAFHSVEDDVLMIGNALSNIDTRILTEILDITERMLGFTASVSRAIEVDNANQRLFQITSLTQGMSKIDVLRLQTLRKMTIVPGTVEEAELADLENRYTTYAIKGMTDDEYMELREVREMLYQREPTNDFVEGPGVLIDKTIDEYTKSASNAGKEIVQTLVLESMKRSSQVSRSTTTIGGLSRTLAEKMFGKKAVDLLVDNRSYLATFNATGARFTFESREPIVASLMHIIGDTLSIKENQFSGLGGTESLRENKVFSKIWLERVSFEFDKLEMVSESNENYKELIKRAYRAAFTGSLTLPPGKFTKAETDQVAALTRAIVENSKNMSDFIYGKGTAYVDSMPVRFDPEVIGSSSIRASDASKAIQRKNREKLHAELSKEFKSEIQDGTRGSAMLFFLTGVLPRDIGTGFVSELKRIRLEQPKALEFLREAAISAIEKGSQKSRKEAEAMVDKALANPDFQYRESGTINQSQDFNIVINHLLSIVTQIYDASNSARNITGIAKNLNALGAVSKLEEAISNTIASGNKVNLSKLNENIRSGNLPDNVNKALQAFSTKKESQFYDLDQASSMSMPMNGTIEELMATLLLARIGEETEYLGKRDFVSHQNFVQNPELFEFIAKEANITLYEADKSQGFRAASKIAVFNATGIAGIDIYQLIDIIRAHKNSIRTENPRALEQALREVEEKLKVEQGLNIKELTDNKKPLVTLLAKYGPDITRMVYGANLNTASIVAEGTLGLVITTLYGGNPVEFLSTVFGSLLSTYVGKEYTRLEQRGEAVNLMMGLERALTDAREMYHLSDTKFDRSAGKVQKIRNWIRANNNRSYMAVLNGMSQQAQNMFRKNINNGNIDKLVTIFSSPNPPRNFNQLKKAMREAGVTMFFRTHLAYEIKQAGLLQPNVLKAYRWMLANVKSPEIQNGNLDLQAAGKFIERTNWNSPSVLSAMGVDFTKQDAYLAIQGIYNLNKAVSNIVSVDPNPWDSATATDAWSIIFNFYRQYPNLFQNQKVMRLGSKMSLADWGIMMVVSAFSDLIYNALLLVALGAIPLTALLPWHKDFMMNSKPEQFMRFLLSRNPIWGASVNNGADAVISYLETVNKLDTTRFTNDVTKSKKGVTAALDVVSPDFVPISASKTLVKPLLTLFVGMTAMVGGNMNSQEAWDLKNEVVSLAGRVVPGVSELPIRIGLRDLMGERPLPTTKRTVGSNRFGVEEPRAEAQAPTTQAPRPTYSTEQLLDKARKPTIEEMAKTPYKAPM